MADNQARCANCGAMRYTDGQFCAYCGAKGPENRPQKDPAWQILKALALAIIAIPFAALGGCAACFVVGMSTMGLPGGLGTIGFPVAIGVGLVVFVVCLVSILKQVKF